MTQKQFMPLMNQLKQKLIQMLKILLMPMMNKKPLKLLL